MDNFRYEFAFHMGMFCGACAVLAGLLIYKLIKDIIQERRDKE